MSECPFPFTRPFQPRYRSSHQLLWQTWPSGKRGLRQATDVDICGCVKLLPSHICGAELRFYLCLNPQALVDGALWYQRSVWVLFSAEFASLELGKTMCPVCAYSEVLGVRNSLPNERLASVASIRTCREKPSKEMLPEECGITMFVCSLMHLSVHLSVYTSIHQPVFPSIY